MNAEAGEEPNPTSDLGEVAAEAVSLVSSDAETGKVVIRTAPSAGSLSVAAEKRAILQILVNILGNAIRHSPENGTVDVSFTAGEQRVGVSIADQGPGIAPWDQDRLFEKYEQGEKPGSTGLGLAISRRLARSMGGDVLVESAPGQGARFMVVLPRA